MIPATKNHNLEVGYNIPAEVGMEETAIQTPCLVIDLDAFERNVAKMKAMCQQMNVNLRAHAKMHKSADIAHYQIEFGDACGICCQKVSEAEALARAGIKDILITNQVRNAHKIDRMARLPMLARITVCIDDPANIAELSKAAQRHATKLEVLVEIECGSGRCGVPPGQPVVALAKSIEAAEGLQFSGIHAYQGAAQHIRKFSERRTAIDKAIEMVRDTVSLLQDAGLQCKTISGGGTGSYRFEGNSGIYNELQCGSYAFMDADYQRVLDEKGEQISEFENALFILTSIISTTKTGMAVCDAGLKVQSVDSGLPVIHGRQNIEYTQCSDEHGIISDPHDLLRVNDTLKLIPGHCDPTCNLHDWYVGIRNGKVETLWPVTARGMAY